MVKIFINLLIRNFLKNKLLNSLNVIGLSLGLIAASLIILYADHELSYDGHYSDAKNIYRFEGRTNSPNWSSNLGFEHGRALKSGNYPEIKNIVQVNNQGESYISFEGRRFVEKNIKLVAPGSDFLELFDFELLEQSRKDPLTAPYAAIITKSTARKYFGQNLAVGKALKYDSLYLTIAAVIEDLPSNTHLEFDILYTNPASFSNTHFHTNTYLKLTDKAEPGQLETKILDMEGVATDEFHKLSEVKLMPIQNIYYDSQAGFGAGGKGDKLQLTLFIVIGLLILLIAITNYINLSLAVYSGKRLEFGMRKVLGEGRAQLTKNLFLESLSISLLTIPLTLIGIKFTLPIFNDFMGLTIENNLLVDPLYWFLGLAFLGVLSGITVINPTITLAKIKTTDLLKSKNSAHTSGGIKLRNVLVFSQFILLFTLGISAWLMNRQIRYLDSKDMGFKADRIIKITNAFDIGGMDVYQIYKTKLLTYPQIGGVSFGPMMGDGMSPMAYKPEGQDEVFENLLSYGVDIDYFDVMGMEILQGDFKDVLLASEAGQVISLVNQNFINKFGWQDDPIGKKIILRPGSENELNRKVSSVFKDFHFFSLKERITPQIISLTPQPQFVNTNILVKANNYDLKSVVEIMETEWTVLNPEIPMQFDFMDDAVKRLYIQEKRTGQISIIFSILAVLLSLLGLVGFMFYVIGLKSKEIAIRKVLGASLLQIVTLLNRQLFLIILLAAIIGSGLSYWLIDTWLRDYAYSIEVAPGTFVLAAIIVYSIVFLITCFQSFKSALFNPSMALKNE
ncbi:ABC transporter permease [Roseivirga sp. E12]|uniref:ABC transporter permease n=1 Tax=Roseivirga sp. E12 TaxID=2819237 RepID=UPI001ABC1C21|nr:ABC transporter permease [Roseivirga sp. E12]MBO3698058.1 ABC transporter permease [Roseivirga sp. E12]